MGEEHIEVTREALEAELAEVRGKLASAGEELGEVKRTVALLERRQKIDALLTEAETVDLEAARLLTEAAVSVMSEEDVKGAVEDLRRHKPYLFRKRGGGASAMPAHGAGEGMAPVEEAAERAAVSGDRRDLLKYLRLRRRS